MIEAPKYYHFTDPADGSVWAYDESQVESGYGKGMKPLTGKKLAEYLNPPVTAVQIATIERQWRDGEIESIKWLRERHRDQLDLTVETTLNGDQFAQLLSYLQLLRDWPQAPDFPDTKSRPIAPGWISAQVE